MWRRITFLIFFSSGLLAHAQWDWGGNPTVITSSLDIGNNDEYAGYEMLDSALTQHNLFLVGESYDYPGFNAKLEFKLLRYMNYKVGLRNYILETSAAKADLVNQYINQEDSSVEKLLQSVSRVKYMRLYKNLKKLNAKLPDSLRIRVYGIDVERSNALPLVKMSQCFSEDSVPDDLRIAVEAIKGAAKYIISRGLEEYEREKEGEDQEDGLYYNPSAFSVRRSVEEFMKMYDSLQPRFEQWLGTRYSEFDHAVGWLRENKTWTKYWKTAFQYTWREEEMFRRMNELLKNNAGEKFFGQFGLCHTSNQRVPEGCGAYSFSGLVHKLRNNPESLGKDVVNIGIFYAAEMDKESEEMNKQHEQYADDLHHLFAKVSIGGAVLADLQKDSALVSLQKDFRYVILNNRFTLREEDAEVDTTTYVDDSYPSGYDLDNKDYRNARIYVGMTSFRNYINLDNLDRELESAGMRPVGDLYYLGGEVGFAWEDKSMVRFYGGTGTSASANYRGSVFFMEGGQAILYKKLIKMGFLTNLGFIQHTITEYSSSDAQTYFTEYISPKIYKNPAFVLGISADMYLDLAPFYIFLAAGRQWDLGRSAWKLDGRATGSRGGVSNTSWTTNLGIGFSVPLHWIDGL